MLTAQIPQRLREAIELEASEYKGSQLVAAAGELSRLYRSGVGVRLETGLARAAYLVTRMPATFAALSCAAREWGFLPLSWLDLGAGPGTAAWVAECECTLVETNEGWQGWSPGRWVRADVRRLPSLEKHEVVSACYVLNELSAKGQARLVTEAWLLAEKAVVIVEPGTVEGFANVRRARQQLVEAGARIQAPCPHDGECPMGDGDWCHFAVRVDRSKMHRMAKGGELSYEDEKFAYLVAMRGESQPCAARVLRHPKVSPHLIELRLCTAEAGMVDRRVVKKEKGEWRSARKADWGGRYA